MSLAVGVAFLDELRRLDDEGFEHFTAVFDRLSTYLAKEGHPGYHEPSELAVQLPACTRSFPYSFLHYLRRAYAHAHAGAKSVPPCPDGEDPAADELIDEELTMHMDSHLVCHSDCEGFYVPIDFADVLYSPDELEIPGCMVGSSVALLRELRLVAEPLGIELTRSAPTARTLADLAAIDDTHPLWRERLVWQTLWVNASASVERRTAIVFY